MKCPRRYESPSSPLKEEDSWGQDDTCSYCGSFNPDMLIQRLEAGDVDLTPTDKNYKLYVDNMGGAKFRMRYRKDCDCEFPLGLSTKQIEEWGAACPHWTMVERESTKFYFQHFSKDQQEKFIEMLNAKKLLLKMPGYFYVLPFFCSRASK